MLSFLKREKSKQLEDKLNDAQRRTGWENLPEDELFTPAGFSEEQAEATASSNYSYWGSVVQNFLKHKAAVVCLFLFLFLLLFLFLFLFGDKSSRLVTVRYRSWQVVCILDDVPLSSADSIRSVPLEICQKLFCSSSCFRTV